MGCDGFLQGGWVGEVCGEDLVAGAGQSLQRRFEGGLMARDQRNLCAEGC